MNELLLFLSSIRWQDVVDVTLNSYILFRLYVLFRGTTTFRALVVIAFLWFFQRIAAYLGLIITSWAVQGVTAVAAIIIIVIFRNEIRSVFQAKNLKALLWGFSLKTIKTPVEIVVESVYEMARKRIGALIVFPAKEDLKELVQNGIAWRGRISKEMIMSIFWPDNPVHDGAAIIQGDQITDVGVILPLSNRKDIPFYYGTRHRAATGLAEITDALVIVVSEERGNVVVAKGSSIRVINRKEELTTILQEQVGVATKGADQTRNEKIKTGLAAVVSVLFVIGVWFSFPRGLESMIALEIPIEYMNRDPKIEILDASVNVVNLNLSGSGTIIKTIRPDQVNVKLDLRKAVIGRNTYTITKENITLPPGAFLKGVNPSVVEVTLDVPIAKELPVQVDWTGKLPENLMLSEAKLYPEKLLIVGGSHILKNISTIYTEKVLLDNISESGKISVKPALNQASLKIALGSKDRILIEYVVKKRLQ
ncbi:MAG: diadenylate cyclase [Proteobacteria bacterium]|nr:diadenylate cyclase [Pseudomonadota bacterium]